MSEVKRAASRIDGIIALRSTMRGYTLMAAAPVMVVGRATWEMSLHFIVAPIHGIYGLQ